MAKQTTQQTQPNREKNPRREPTASGEKDASVNRNASHNYFLLEKFEAGVVLTGTEVKSVRTGKTNLKDAYGLIKDGELWLLNCHIGPYDHGNYANHAALRTRKQEVVVTRVPVYGGIFLSGGGGLAARIFLPIGLGLLGSLLGHDTEKKVTRRQGVVLRSQF